MRMALPIGISRSTLLLAATVCSTCPKLPWAATALHPVACSSSVLDVHRGSIGTVATHPRCRSGIIYAHDSRPQRRRGGGSGGAGWRAARRECLAVIELVVLRLRCRTLHNAEGASMRS